MPAWNQRCGKSGSLRRRISESTVLNAQLSSTAMGSRPTPVRRQGCMSSIICRYANALRANATQNVRNLAIDSAAGDCESDDAKCNWLAIFQAAAATSLTVFGFAQLVFNARVRTPSVGTSSARHLSDVVNCSVERPRRVCQPTDARVSRMSSQEKIVEFDSGPRCQQRQFWIQRRKRRVNSATPDRSLEFRMGQLIFRLRNNKEIAAGH